VLLLESGILWLAMKNVHSNVVFSDNLQHLDDLLTTMHRNQDHKNKNEGVDLCSWLSLSFVYKLIHHV